LQSRKDNLLRRSITFDCRNRCSPRIAVMGR